MESPNRFFSSAGRIAPKPFVLAALAVYIASFLSQFLLASPVIARASIVPFVAVQAVLAWAWCVLHVRRLRDAGRGPGSAVAVTILYSLAIVLLLLVMSAANNAPTSDSSGFAVVGILGVLVFVFLAALVIGNAAFGMFGYALLGALMLITLTVVIGTVFTIWLANRRSVPASPP